MTTITSSDIVREVRILASEKPGFTYRPPEQDWEVGCKYVHRDNEGLPVKGEGCIVGQALARLGHIVPPELEGTGAWDLLPYVASEAGDGSWLLNRRWLSYVQSIQDAGRTWSTAVSSADFDLPLRTGGAL